MRPDLQELATILSDWLEGGPAVPAIYVFGSRVRGDHRVDSDVDIRVFLNEWRPDHQTMVWWRQENETDFRNLKAKLPGPLAIHREATDAADDAIRAGAATPELVVGRVVCVLTPPRT